MESPLRAMAVLVVGLAVAGGLAGCSNERAQPALGPGATGWPSPIADEDRIPWATGEPLFVVIRKTCRTLDVYRYGERIRSYPAVFGLGGTTPKLYEGDLRTPQGFYSIIETRRHPRWRHFFLLDYPNTGDAFRYRVALGGGAIPKRGAGYAGMGGAVGIHGTDRPDLNERDVDWTWGCISLNNPDMDELARLVKVGTPVLIED